MRGCREGSREADWGGAPGAQGREALRVIHKGGCVVMHLSHPQSLRHQERTLWKPGAAGEGMCRCGVADCKDCPTGGDAGHGGGRGAHGKSLPSPQFCSEPQTALTS